MSDSLDHSIEEVVAREFAGRDWVRNTRIDTRKQPQSTWTCTHRERERERVTVREGHKGVRMLCVS